MRGVGARRGLGLAIASLLATPVVLLLGAAPAGAVDVSTEAQLQASFADGAVSEIDLVNDIDLTCAGGGDLDRNSANPLTINGNGFTIRQTCADERVMELIGGGAFTLESTTITGGNLNNQGGGIKSGNPGSGGPMTIRNSTITGNSAGGSSGGGIVQVGDVPLTVIGSTVSNNSGSGGSAVAGGELFINSTITGNTAGAVGGALAGDGGTTLVYSTVIGNTAETGDPANVNHSTLVSFGSVIGDPLGTAVNCSVGTTTSAGYNYEQSADTCGFSPATNDVVNGADPLLGALADNGGPTPTRLPVSDSPLVDAIPTTACGDGDALAGFAVTADQRGLPRPEQSGGACDIGAVEAQVEVVPPAPPPAPPAPIGAVVRFTG